jgi:hypothetical protein
MGESRSNNGKADDNIVGTWHVSYTVEGSPFAQAFIQWHSDGTEWENINLPVLGGNANEIRPEPIARSVRADLATDTCETTPKQSHWLA